MDIVALTPLDLLQLRFGFAPLLRYITVVCYSVFYKKKNDNHIVVLTLRHANDRNTPVNLNNVRDILAQEVNHFIEIDTTSHSTWHSYKWPERK